MKIITQITEFFLGTSFLQHAYLPAGKLLCSSLKETMAGVPALFPKLLRNASEKLASSTNSVIYFVIFWYTEGRLDISFGEGLASGGSELHDFLRLIFL